MTDYLADLHDNGVHTLCMLADRWPKGSTTGKRIGDGTHRKCVAAGTIARFHSHDHDGPLECGCEETG